MSFRQITETTRIEAGPPRKKAVATEELLSDRVTASHYQVGRLDALGKPIQLSQEMDYIDWLCPNKVWYVYKLDDNGIYQRVGVFDDEIDAALHAKEIAG
jgi:hypothetical protein